MRPYEHWSKQELEVQYVESAHQGLIWGKRAAEAVNSGGEMSMVHFNDYTERARKHGSEMTAIAAEMRLRGYETLPDVSSLDGTSAT